MGLLSLNLPVIGQSSATEDQKVRDAIASVQTLLNGNVDEANVPNLAAAFTSYKTVVSRAACEHTSAAVAGTYLLSLATPIGNSAPGSAVAAYNTVIHLDPALFTANARTTRGFLRLAVVTNAVAPAITFTAGLYPVATISGASGALPIIATLGAVTAGSTAAVASPPATAVTAGTSGDFNFPAAGAYAFAHATSGTPAAGSIAHLVVQLMVRQV